MSGKKNSRGVGTPGDRREPGRISLPVLLSCYAASILIIVICLQERASLVAEGSSDGLPYLVLAALGLAASVFITYRYFEAGNRGKSRTGKK